MKGILKVRPITILGLMLLAVGFVGPVVFATVTITSPTITAGYPSGTLTSPTALTAGATYEIYCTTFGTKPASVWVEIDRGNDGTMDENVALTYSEVYQGYYKFRKLDWVAPTTNITIKFTWKAVGITGSAISYGQTTAPNGNFYINDQLVTMDSVITFYTRTLNFRFEATAYASDITRVLISITGVTSFDLTKQANGTTWNGHSWTATADGTYTIYGYFYKGTQSWRNLSIQVGANTPPVPPTELSTYDYLKIIGGLMVIGGLIFKK